MKIAGCKCGCGQVVKGKRVFVNKEHQLQWMVAGGARELNAMMSDEARALGGHLAGMKAVESGRLREASGKGAARSREIAQEFQAKKTKASAAFTNN